MHTQRVTSVFDSGFFSHYIWDMTPLMRQYWDIKAAHEDKVLLFRMGDFFEMFFDDAVKAAPVVGIALTQRNKKSADETPMCGVPHHSIAGPINKLLKAGFKIAICDQIEDPKLAKGIVKRAVTRVLTPGMVYDSETLSQSESNYMACLDSSGLACVETSTGESFYFEVIDHPSIQRLLSVLPIAELVVEKKSEQTERTTAGFFSGLITEHNTSLVSEVRAEKISCVRRLLSYVQSLGGEESLKTIQPFEKRNLQQRLDLSGTVLRHLEIFSTYKGEGAGSLFSAIDRTKTSAGARTLRSWLSFPLTHREGILERQGKVENWTRDLPKLKVIREILSNMGDIERRLGKIGQPQCHGRDLLSLADSIQAGLSAAQICECPLTPDTIERLGHLVQEIQDTLVDEPPLQVKQGHLIRKGYTAELDELIELSTDSQALLQKMETEEREKTGISSLKIRYNSVFGYYIEITNTHKDKVPVRYLRKQTLTNAERYCTDELVELEKKVLSAQARRGEVEYQIFENLRQTCLNQAQDLLQLSTFASSLDVITSFAWLALERKYVKPEFSADRSLRLKASRHPVVEQTVKKQFVPNDIELSPEGCLLLTGPNMAGKSTLMRQVALTAILAQVGSFVPADQAEIPLFDHIFTRIGASDQLSEGLSTFMVEMTETSEMLQKSSEHSLLILDEIGRGTSTYDGMSLAQAILEYLLEEKKAMTLFATHYHELTGLDQRYTQLMNAHMTVSESSGEIYFLHTLAQGPAQKSYGIQVARLAGLPKTITHRALGLLKALELSKPGLRSLSKEKTRTAQLSLLEFHEEEESQASENLAVLHELQEQQKKVSQLEAVIRDFQKYPVNEKSPMEALNFISQWQQQWQVQWQKKFKDISQADMPI